MEIMEQKDSMIQIQSQNHSKLVKELKELMDQMDIPHKYQMALLDKGVLSSPRGIMECTAAAECLQKKMEATPHLGINCSCFRDVLISKEKMYRGYNKNVIGLVLEDTCQSYYML